MSWQRFSQRVDAEEVETLNVRELLPQRSAQLVEDADAFEDLPLLVGREMQRMDVGIVVEGKVG
ncbi:MAG: hypothetical protein OXQ29_00485 [Rhodospirillaceae bacterium]|nr:hypothetical protein [Rhodospirillaceae bacterium]